MSKSVASIETDAGQDTLFRDEYFPTMVFSAKIHDAQEMNREILAAIRAEQARDAKGVERSNFRALGGWHSRSGLHRNPKFDRLTKRIEAMLSGISSTLGYDSDYDLRISMMWAITNPPPSSNRAHVHPGSLWSGVYYVQVPENAGNIEFTDPRVVASMNAAKFATGKMRPVECWNKVNVGPTAGQMLIFPAWLYHGVEPNLAKGRGPDADRIIVSFNVNQFERPD